MPPAMQEYRSEPVPAITRVVNVEALNSCSAYSTSDVCIARTHEACGGRRCSSVKEVRADRVRVVLDLDADAGARVVVPVEQHAAERGDEPIGDVARMRSGLIALGLDATERGDAASHDVHRMRRRGQGFENFANSLR